MFELAWDSLFFRRGSWYSAIYPAIFPDFDCQYWPSVHNYNQYCQDNISGLVNSQNKPIRFIEQLKKNHDSVTCAYEPLIYEQGQVLTRAQNWHDFFNMLVWSTFPKSKATLNALQYHSLQARQKSGILQRTAQENFLTLFDENGLLLYCDNSHIVELIREHQWQDLFWQHRSLLPQLKVIVFGHALYEKLLNPYIGLTGHAVLFPLAAANTPVTVDQQLALYLDKTILHPKLLQPFPLLGLPGAFPGNNCLEFYEDKRYFRPKDRQKIDSKTTSEYQQKN